MELECIKHGFRLRDAGHAYPWRDVLVVVRCAPPGSLIAGALNPRMAWTVDQVLAADRVDQMNNFMWSLGGEHGKRPTPVPRPWVEDKVRKFTGKTMSRGEADDMVAALRGGRLGRILRSDSDIEGEVDDD